MPAWLEATWPARLLVAIGWATPTELDRMSIDEVMNWLDMYQLWKAAG